jgi:hypothetical protein
LFMRVQEIEGRQFGNHHMNGGIVTGETIVDRAVTTDLRMLRNLEDRMLN